MKLGDLIDETLSEIARGVRAAKERSWEVLAIAPGRINGQQTTEITYIDFDVSLVVSEGGELASSKDGRLGGGLTVASIMKFDGSGGSTEASKSSASSQLTHRVSFKVTVCMGATFSAK